MFTVSLIEPSTRVQNEISTKVMPKPQNFIAGATLRAPLAFRDKLVARPPHPTKLKCSHVRNVTRVIDPKRGPMARNGVL
jgi:hypothetical protein